MQFDRPDQLSWQLAIITIYRWSIFILNILWQKRNSAAFFLHTIWTWYQISRISPCFACNNFRIFFSSHLHIRYISHNVTYRAWRTVSAAASAVRDVSRAPSARYFPQATTSNTHVRNLICHIIIGFVPAVFSRPQIFRSETGGAVDSHPGMHEMVSRWFTRNHASVASFDRTVILSIGGERKNSWNLAWETSKVRKKLRLTAGRISRVLAARVACQVRYY